MPSYAEPLKIRILQTMIDVVREYPENLEGRRRWADRMFFRHPPASAPIPLSVVWQDGGPRLVKQFVAAMRLLESRIARSLLRLALDDRSKSSENAFIAALQVEREQAV
jgi:hypothetical protein